MQGAGAYDAVVLDLDGTLVADDGCVRPSVADALARARGRGVGVMLATGRSALGTALVASELDLELPCVVFNGGGLWEARSNRWLEERLLSNRSVDRTFALAREHGLYMVVMVAGRKYTTPPRNEVEERGLVGLDGLEVVAWEALPREMVMRISVFSAEHGTSAELAALVDQAVAQPLYLTDFPLAWLANHRESPLQVVDVQPPSRGKGEAVRYLVEEHGLDPARIVAVGDATNDIPMFEAAGLGVAMGNAMPEAKAHAQRVIGDCNGDALAELIDELFPVG